MVYYLAKMETKKKILIIDDEEQDRKSMAVALQRAGYGEISTAASAKDGLEIAKTFKPDVVLVDIVLPNADGFDVCKEIKAIKGADAKVVIMITGHLDAIDANKARSSGADEIIEKTPGFENISPTISSLSKK